LKQNFPPNWRSLGGWNGEDLVQEYAILRDSDAWVVSGTYPKDSVSSGEEGAQEVEDILKSIFAELGGTDGERQFSTQELLVAAERAVARFTFALDTPEMKEADGFPRDDDFSRLSFGTPFRQQLLRIDEMGKGQMPALSGMLIDTEEWFIPVLSRGEIACLLTVIRNSDGSFHGGRVGMRELARAWQAVAEAWPEEGGFSPSLVIYPDSRQFFYHVPEADTPNLTPLDIHAAGGAGANTRHSLAPAWVTLRALKNRE
jgi:hypothetical protein